MKIDNKARIDIISTFANQLWRLISGPVTLLLIPMFLSPVQQGYWYLFTSLSALSIFADLGFSNIILQFSAHEFAFLEFDDNGLLTGSNEYLKKLGSFFRFVLKWICSISIIVFPLIYAVGIIFFIRDDVQSIYLFPWTIYALGSLLSFISNSILSFIEGMDKIAIIQKIRLRVTVVNTLIVVIVLVMHGNIYALSIAMLISTSTIFISIFGTFKAILLQLLLSSENFTYEWRKEVLPLFFRYALSWSSGYLIFQIYTPLMHLFHGPVHSGRVGITLSLITAIFNISNIWIYTIMPRINMLVSRKDWYTLDSLFNKRLLIGIITYLVVGFGTALFIVLFGDFWVIPKIVSRFLPMKPLLILFLCYFFQLIVNSWAVYLRGHKQEPFVLLSILSAIWIFLTTYVAGRYIEIDYFFSGFLSSYLWVLPLSYYIYRRCRNKWHE